MSSVFQMLAERVSELEKTVQEIKAILDKENEPWWEKTAGMFKGDPVFAEIVREMEKARKADYEAICRELDREDRKKRAKPNHSNKRIRKTRRSAG